MGLKVNDTNKRGRCLIRTGFELSWKNCHNYRLVELNALDAADDVDDGVDGAGGGDCG